MTQTLKFQIPLTKAGELLEAEVSLDNPSFPSLVYNGLKQALNDAMAGDKGLPNALKVWDKIQAGEYIHRDLREEGEPGMEKFLAMATRTLLANTLKAKGIKKSDLPEGKYAELLRQVAQKPAAKELADKLRAEAQNALALDLDF
jgi:hypothetical protein